MEIDELVEKIMDRFKIEQYDCNDYEMTILSGYKDKEERLCRTILKEELLEFIKSLNTDVIEYKNKCESYEVLISNSNFKMATEKINNRKKKEVEKDA